MTREQLVLAARPHDVLLPSEADRVTSYVEMFREQLARISDDPDNPTQVDLVCARAAASSIWLFDRQGAVGPELHALLRRQTAGNARRQELFAELETRHAMTNLLLQRLRQVDSLREQAQAAPVATHAPTTRNRGKV